MTELYDRIGRRYSGSRRADPTIMAQLAAALGPLSPVLNVGAGSGSYEPADRHVIAVEPSLTMLRQRAPSAAAAVQSRAEALPFADAAFAAVLGVLTLHHWTDLRRGLEECARVARECCVFVTFDPAAMASFWLLDYFPSALLVDAGKSADPARFPDIFTSVVVAPLEIPWDCRDGFLGAYWRRPEAYLDARVREGISSFAKLSAAELEDGLRRLEHDLTGGAWHLKHAPLIRRETADLGYRIVTCRQ